MKYEDFEKAQELRDEISKLHDIAKTLQPDEYADGDPVWISRVSCGGLHSTPVCIPVELAIKLAAMVWEQAEEKEKEFEAL